MQGTVAVWPMKPNSPTQDNTLERGGRGWKIAPPENANCVPPFNAVHTSTVVRGVTASRRYSAAF